MAQNYEIRKTGEVDLGFYKKCFGNATWRRKYGALENEIFLDDYVKQIGFVEYPSVIRLICLRNTEPIGFCHVESIPADNRCIISGGVDPELIGQGVGVIVACMSTEFIFSELKINKICVEVVEYNKAIFRVLSKLGFAHEGTAKKHRYDHSRGRYFDSHFLGLLKEDYPNEFAKRILARTKYEKR